MLKERKAQLREFANKFAVEVLERHGGEMAKQDLHTEVEAGFTERVNGWPPVLDGIDGVGRRHASNAIAWALRDLAMEGRIEPTTGVRTVRLPNAKKRSTKPPRKPKLGRPANTYKKQIAARARVAARRAMVRARAAGIPFDPDFPDQAVEAVRAQGYRCAMSGEAFDVEYKTEGAGGTHFAPSPDRIDPKKGYVRSNVRWVLWAVNRGRGEMDWQRFVQMCRGIAEKNGKG